MFNETSYLGAVSFSPSQQDIAARIVQIGQQRGESEKHIQAALATGWVESRFRNLAAGDRDSAGVMQQRPSRGWGTYQQVTDLDYAINAFYDAADRIDDTNMTFGQLAQAVQRSAYPARYGQAAGIVDQILAALGFSSGGDAGSSGDGSGLPSPVETLTQPVDLFSGAPAWLPLVALGVGAYFVFSR